MVTLVALIKNIGNVTFDLCLFVSKTYAPVCADALMKPWQLMRSVGTECTSYLISIS